MLEDERLRATIFELLRVGPGDASTSSASPTSRDAGALRHSAPRAILKEMQDSWMVFQVSPGSSGPCDALGGS